MHQAQAEQLWQLVYSVFERTALDAGRTVLVNKGQANDMQFALMNKIAALKHAATSDEREPLLEEIYSGFLGMEAVGLLSSETVQQAERILSGQKE